MSLRSDIFRELIGEPDKQKPGTHAHFIGSSGAGKSKGLEYLARHILEHDDVGFAVIDWAGTLYRDLVAYMAYMDFDREIYLLNVADPTHVTPWNPFQYYGGDAGTFVSQMVDLTVKPWGAANTNETPTIERISRVLYHTVIAANETLPNVAEMFDYGNRYLAAYALRVLDTPDHRVGHRKLKELMDTGFRDWRNEVRSTDSRLTRFLDSKMFQRVVGFREGKLNIREALDRNAIVLVNLAQTEDLYVDAARVFAAMLLSDFFNAAKKRNGTEKRFVLILDEFQEYLTHDLASMLDGVRKGGLNLILAHQHLGHLAEDDRLRHAIMTNARIKAIFGGLDYESAIHMVRETLLDEANERWIKDEFYSQEVADHELMEVPTLSLTTGSSEGASQSAARGSSKSFGKATNQSQSTGSSESEKLDNYEHPDRRLSESMTLTQSGSQSEGRSESEMIGSSEGRARSKSATVGTTYMLRPVYRERLSGRSDYSLEEKLHILAQRLMQQPDRNFTLRLKNQPARREIVPTLQDYSTNDEIVGTYERRIYEKTGALELAEADRQLVESRANFFETAKRTVQTKKEKPPASNRPKLV